MRVWKGEDRFWVHNFLLFCQTICSFGERVGEP
jgi:hypothetical protein